MKTYLVINFFLTLFSLQINCSDELTVTSFEHSPKSPFTIVESIAHRRYHKRMIGRFFQTRKNNRNRLSISIKDCPYRYCHKKFPEYVFTPKDGFKPSRILTGKKKLKCNSCAPRNAYSEHNHIDQHRNVFVNYRIKKGSIRGGGFVFG